MMLKEQVKALWKICFDDSEEFVEMYFRLRYKTEVNVAIQSGDEYNRFPKHHSSFSIYRNILE